MLGWLQSMLAPLLLLLSMSPLVCGNKPKVLVVREVYHMVVTSNIRMNKKAVLLEGNMQKYAEVENVTAQDTCGRSQSETFACGLCITECQ